MQSASEPPQPSPSTTFFPTDVVLPPPSSPPPSNKHVFARPLILPLPHWKSSLNLTSCFSEEIATSTSAALTDLKCSNKSFEAPAKLASSPTTAAAISRCRSLSQSIDDEYSLSSENGEGSTRVRTSAAAILFPDSLNSSDNTFGDLIKEAESGFGASCKLVMADNAMGGTYFLTNSAGKKVLVCKPADEELNGPNNPHILDERRDRSRSWESYKGKITPGFGMYREIAVYVLDSQVPIASAGVPTTTLAKIRHPSFCRKEEEKQEIADSWSGASTSSASPSFPSGGGGLGGIGGSSRSMNFKCCALQVYVEHKYDADDIGYSNFNVEEVQKIAILDIRVCNLDRHGGNLLVCNDRNPTSSSTKSASVPFYKQEACGGRLVPIDHGYCLPHVNYMSDATFVWMTWPQVKQPVTQALVEYVASIDIDSNIHAIERAVGSAIPETSLLTLIFCTMYLKRGVSAGLSLYEIGSQMIARFDDIDDYKIDFSGTSNIQRAARRAIRKVLSDYSSAYYVSPSGSPTSVKNLDQFAHRSLLNDENIIFASQMKSDVKKTNRLIEAMEMEIDALISNLLMLRS